MDRRSTRNNPRWRQRAQSACIAEKVSGAVTERKALARASPR